MTMFISLHYDRKFLTGTFMVYYSKDLVNSFMVNDETSIWDLKSMDLRMHWLWLRNIELKIGNPIEHCNTPDRCFVKLLILNEASWRGMYGWLKGNETMIMELYVKTIPIELGVESSG